MSTNVDPKDRFNSDNEESSFYYPESWAKEDAIEEMKRKHPGHGDPAYQTGKMLGVDFPYVPGDPGW